MHRPRVALAAMTIAALVAWQYSNVRQRRDTRLDVMSYVRVTVVPGASGAGEEVRVNPLRALLGDEAFRCIYVSDEAIDPQLDRLQRLFPEAKVELRKLIYPLAA